MHPNQVQLEGMSVEARADGSGSVAQTKKTGHPFLFQTPNIPIKIVLAGCSCPKHDAVNNMLDHIELSGLSHLSLSLSSLSISVCFQRIIRVSVVLE